MSIISDALRTAKHVYFLLDLDFGGVTYRWSTKTLSVPITAGGAYLYDAQILKELSIKNSLNLQQMRYSLSGVSVEVANAMRLQDVNRKAMLDGSPGTIRAWCDGLTWENIEDEGVISRGIFETVSWDAYAFRFQLTDYLTYKSKTIPGGTISIDSWPNHLVIGGGGSVSGKAGPLVFGRWTKGVPLLNVDTTAYKYLLSQHTITSTDAEYNAGTYNVYDKTGVVIGAAGYAMSQTTDSEGNPCTIFTFTGDQTANEPLTCSCHGIKDVDGLIEHPCDIILWLLENYSTLTPDDIDYESIGEPGKRCDRCRGANQPVRRGPGTCFGISEGANSKGCAPSGPACDNGNASAGGVGHF